MRLITDPAEVERRAEELQEENWAFRDWIKGTKIELRWPGRGRWERLDW